MQQLYASFSKISKISKNTATWKFLAENGSTDVDTDEGRNGRFGRRNEKNLGRDRLRTPPAPCEGEPNDSAVSDAIAKAAEKAQNSWKQEHQLKKNSGGNDCVDQENVRKEENMNHRKIQRK